jgi:hypothetical protein
MVFVEEIGQPYFATCWIPAPVIAGNAWRGLTCIIHPHYRQMSANAYNETVTQNSRWLLMNIMLTEIELWTGQPNSFGQ